MFVVVNCTAQSRRDDLESLGYSIVYFLSDSLPWEKHHSEYSKNISLKKEMIESGIENNGWPSM